MIAGGARPVFAAAAPCVSLQRRIVRDGRQPPPPPSAVRRGAPVGRRGGRAPHRARRCAQCINSRAPRTPPPPPGARPGCWLWLLTPPALSPPTLRSVGGTRPPHPPPPPAPCTQHPHPHIWAPFPPPYPGKRPMAAVREVQTALAGLSTADNFASAGTVGASTFDVCVRGGGWPPAAAPGRRCRRRAGGGGHRLGGGARGGRGGGGGGTAGAVGAAAAPAPRRGRRSLPPGDAPRPRCGGGSSGGGDGGGCRTSRQWRRAGAARRQGTGAAGRRLSGQRRSRCPAGSPLPVGGAPRDGGGGGP